jgi:hypothetical protein
VRAGASRLRAETSARVMIGALGPRMRRLAVTAADGPLLSWLTPDAAAAQARGAHAVAPRAHVALYVRTALDAAAIPRLEAEAERYGSFPAYAANFARLGLTPRDTVIAPDDAAARMGRYRAAVDEVVLRAVTADDRLETLMRFVDRAAGLALAR